jgi:predicted nucleic acid-binding Zn ribbon protein
MFRHPPKKKRKYCSDTCRGNAAVEAYRTLSPGKDITINFESNLKSDKFVCICCGKELKNGARNFKLYCSGSCEYYYKKMTTPEERAVNRKILESGRLRRMRTQEFKCAYCDKIFTALSHQKRQYCSHSCHNKAQIEHYARVDAQKLDEIIKRLDDAKTLAEYICVYCGKPLPKRRQIYCDEKCKRGYEKITTFEEREQNRELIRKVRKFPEKQCVYCGKTFAVTVRYNQQYCSVECYRIGASSYHADIAALKTLETSERLYRVMTTGEPICIYCGEQLPRNDNGRLFCSKKCIAAFYNKRRPKKIAPGKIVKIVNGQYHERYHATKNTVEWLEILQIEMRNNYFEHSGMIDCQKSAQLMCATTHINRSAHSFAAVIASKGFDPFDGDYYAFCSGTQDKIRYIQFDAGGFQMVSRQNEYGKYIWPAEKFGEFVTLTAQEFEFILKGSNTPEFSPKIIV